MTANRDFVELFVTFNDHGVDYLVVGAHALAAHGHVRATKDLDVWVRPSSDNSERVFAALSAFGAPLEQVVQNDFAQPGVIFQIGVAPVRIDIITRVDGLEFDEAWPDRVMSTFGGIAIAVLSKHHLIQNKKASGRLQDLADIERLQASEES